MAKTLTLSVPFHTIERYLDGVVDSEKHYRTDEEIRAIIRGGFNDSVGMLPKKIPQNYRHTVELRDPDTGDSFGMYHIPLWADHKMQFDLVAKTLLETCMS